MKHVEFDVIICLNYGNITMTSKCLETFIVYIVGSNTICKGGK